MVLTLDSYWGKMNVLRDFLKATRDWQFFMVLFIRFQINGPWLLIVFSAIFNECP